MPSAPKPTTLLIVLGALGVIIAVAAREPILDLFRTKAEPRPPELKLPPTPEEVAKPHLEKAEQDSIRAIDEHIQAVETFFADAKTGTRPFAEEALSWASKWRLVVDHVPFTKGGRHEIYIRQRFEQHVFKASDLENVVTQVVTNYLAHVRSVENKMLVDLRTMLQISLQLIRLPSSTTKSYRTGTVKQLPQHWTRQEASCVPISQRNWCRSLLEKSSLRLLSAWVFQPVSSAPVPHLGRRRLESASWWD